MPAAVKKSLGVFLGLMILGVALCAIGMVAGQDPQYRVPVIPGEPEMFDGWPADMVFAGMFALAALIPAGVVTVVLYLQAKRNGVPAPTDADESEPEPDPGTE